LKNVLSIFLLTIALFNLGGYGLFMACLEERANEKMEIALDDDNYDPSTLISIKVPIKNLPYYTNSAQFQRQDGRIEIGGVQYNYVQQRIYRDTLEVLCVPNNAATKLSTARNDFYKLVNDLENAGQNKKQGAGSPFKFFSPYNYNEQSHIVLSGSHDIKKEKATRPTVIIPFYYATVIENPPELY
jgi:hypothetical protein